MTENEAIEELKSDKNLYETETCRSGDGTPDGDLIQALDLAIQALEKQIPKKAITHSNTNRADCPCCGATVRGIKNSFGDWCSNCGQKLDWSKVVE